jgi:hypothetical protein
VIAYTDAAFCNTETDRYRFGRPGRFRSMGSCQYIGFADPQYLTTRTNCRFSDPSWWTRMKKRIPSSEFVANVLPVHSRAIHPHVQSAPIASTWAAPSMASVSTRKHCASERAIARDHRSEPHRSSKRRTACAAPERAREGRDSVRNLSSKPQQRSTQFCTGMALPRGIEPRFQP